MVDETKLNDSNQAGNVVSAGEGNAADAKRRELQQAVELVNKGLDGLSPEELTRIYRILKTHSGEPGAAGEAFAKLDAFAQKQVKDFAEGKEKVAPEDLTGIQNLETEIVTVHNPETRELSAAERVEREKRELDAQLGLTHLSPSFKPVIDKNLSEMDAMLAGFDAFARKPDGTPLHPEMANIADFFEHVDLQAGKEDGVKDKEELRRELLEMAILQAESELAVNPAFAGLSAAEKRKRLLQAIGSHADAMALEMLKAQFLADFQTENAELLAHKDNLTPEEEKELEKKIREFNDKVKTAARGYIERKYPSGHYSLSGTNAAAVIIANSRNQVAVNNRIAEKTGHKTLKERALGFDARMKEKYPKLYPAVKKGIVSGIVGYATGGVGLAALSAYRSYQLVRTSYKTYKDSGFEGSYWNYLKNNKKELVSLTTSVVLTGVSAYFGGSDVVQHGWNAVGMVGRAIGDTAADKAGDKLLKAAIRGTISVTSGLTNAGMDFRAALNEPDKARRKQLYKQAALTAGISIFSGAVGVFSAEYGDKAFGWLRERFSSHDAGVDGVTGAAPKVSGVQPQPVQQTPDFSRLNENQLDAKLHELGVNPKVYEEMSPAQKAILLNRRVEELGSLAKETPENVVAAQNAENGPVSETQLKNMLARNAERHPGVDMNKVYGQLKAAGIKNPEEAFYKLEQARLLAPNDKIMTVDGTNIRDTFSRALKGEALSKADMEIISRSAANVDNTGHYLNDVRAQGGTGYSYRPNGKIIANEQEHGGTPRTGSVKNGEVSTENPETQPSGSKMLDVEKMSEADRKLYESMMASFRNGKTDDWQLEANKAYLKYCQLRTDGKTEEAEAFAKTFAKPQPTETVNEDGNKDKDENNPYRVEKGDGKALIAAKREAARAEAAWKASVEKVRLTGKGVDEVKDLPLDDKRRIDAEYKHALAMKEEVKKQMEFSKKEIKLAKAERDQLGDDIEARKKMEARMTEIGRELKRYGIDKTDAPAMTGDYGEDRRAVREYYKDVLSNKKHHGPAMKLLKEREELLGKMREQGPLPLMEQKYADAEARVDVLNKREQYRENQERETGTAAMERRTLEKPLERQDQPAPSQNAADNETEASRPNTDRLDQAMIAVQEGKEREMDSYATVSLADSKGMENGQFFSAKDKLGNNQYVGVDKDGHAFRLTEFHNLNPDGKTAKGQFLRIEVEENHPLYKALNSESIKERIAAQQQFYKEFKQSCADNEITSVKASRTAGSAGRSSGVER